MYHLDDPVTTVSGIGDKIAAELAQKNITTIRDLLLMIPLRYDDRTTTTTVADLLNPTDPPKAKAAYTLRVQLQKASSVYIRGKSMQKATFIDESGDALFATWFHNPHIVKSLRHNEWYRVSGVVKILKNNVFITQPVVEAQEKAEVNTNRLVPIYPQLRTLKPTTVRKVFLDILRQLEPLVDTVDAANADHADISSLQTAIHQLHNPSSIEEVTAGRRRLALEELLVLIQRSKTIKKQWKSQSAAVTLPSTLSAQMVLPPNLPFNPTAAQLRSIAEILTDMTHPVAMNRLLLGDVGSGKTLVAAAAMKACLETGVHSCLIAPTQVLAEQHASSLRALYCDVEIILITGATKKQYRLPSSHKPCIIVGTHAVLNTLENHSLETPIGLIVFDEQHRFGVRTRSTFINESANPHILTMTATPIPRSLMLTIFSHLSLSILDELPANRIPTKTWLLPAHKREPMLSWLADQIRAGKQPSAQTDQEISTNRQFQALVVCPFIDPSAQSALENVAAVSEQHARLVSHYAGSDIKIALLHGRQTRTAQAAVIEQLRAGTIDIVVTTPIVEVGIDLPQASCMVIEDAQRFGLASLHQLRGRVGRSGQQGYCIVFHTTKSADSTARLQFFAKTTNGAHLAEYDLRHRGAGDLFGTQQHGFDELRFANWSDVDLIARAKQVTDTFGDNQYTSQLLHPCDREITPDSLAAN